MPKNPDRETAWAADQPLESIPALAWQMLADGAARATAAFHTPVLATQAEAGPELRTVVLRAADPEQQLLICHTDLRSPKLRQISLRNSTVWLFYDALAKVQLRIKAVATLHQGDELARQRWQASSEQSRQCYRNRLAPGAEVEDPDDAILALPDDGFVNFAVIRSQVQSLEWLYLRAAGHRRARFVFNNGQWQGAWLAP
jgi:hypothetical protein